MESTVLQNAEPKLEKNKRVLEEKLKEEKKTEISDERVELSAHCCDIVSGFLRGRNPLTVRVAVSPPRSDVGRTSVVLEIVENFSRAYKVENTIQDLYCYRRTRRIIQERPLPSYTVVLTVVRKLRRRSDRATQLETYA